jgi:hypothetical protein
MTQALYAHMNNKRKKKERDHVSKKKKIKRKSRRWSLTPVILATQEAEIRRIMAQSQPGQIVCRDPILKIPITKKDCVVAQVVERTCLKSTRPSVQTPVLPKKKKKNYNT